MFIRKVGLYQLYALFLFLITYLLNQLDRYMLAITIKPMAQELEFGDKGCMFKPSDNYTEDDLGSVKCNAKEESRYDYFFIELCEPFTSQQNFSLAQIESICSLITLNWFFIG